MKRFVLVLFAVCLIVALSVPAFASAGDGTEAGEGETVVDAGTDTSTVYDDSQLVGVSVYTLAPVVSSDVTGLKAVLLNFLGSYDAVVVEYEYQGTGSSYSTFVRELQPDYVWLCSCALLVVMVFCLFRMGGSLLCRK